MPFDHKSRLGSNKRKPDIAQICSVSPTKPRTQIEVSHLSLRIHNAISSRQAIPQAAEKGMALTWRAPFPAKPTAGVAGRFKSKYF